MTVIPLRPGTTWLVWSFKHGQWWGRDQRGYASSIEEAGRYGAEDACRIMMRSVLSESIAIHEDLAISNGPPTVTGLWSDSHHGQ